MTTYTIWIRTGDQPLSGTDSNVFIQLFGQKGHTQSIHLPPEDIFAFEQGNTDRFVLEAPDIGPLNRCCIGQDASADSGWYVETVRVQHDELGQEWTFAFDRWLGVEESGSLTACVES